MKLKIFSLIVVALVLCASYILISCNLNSIESNTSSENRTDIVDSIDYYDWYCDIDNRGEYNYTRWIELDVWFKEEQSDNDWSGTTFDVAYNGKPIASNIAVTVEEAFYIQCYFDTTYEGAMLTDNGYLAAGIYEISLRDKDGNHISTSTCTVSVDSGNVLSEMLVNTEKIDSINNELAVRFSFDGDITPYSRIGYYITVSLDGGESSFVPEEYSVEPAKTYLIIRYFPQNANEQNLLVSLFCTDGTLVCSCEV